MAFTVPVAPENTGVAVFGYTRSRWLDKLYPQKWWDRLVEFWRGFM